MDYSPQKPLYHGARADFEKPKLNGQGILWLALNPKVALDYATPHYHKGDSYLWEIRLKGNAKIIDLGDLSNPIIQELRQGFISPVTNQPIAEADWPSYADFGILEAKRWVRGFLRKKRVDGLTVKDALGTTAIQHDSVALLNLGAIASLDKKVVPAGSVPSNRTLQEIEDDLRTASERVAHRYLVASFKPGDYVLYGRFRNKRARVVRVFEDSRGIPYIEIQPVPKGRKKNRVFGLYTIRQMTPESVQEAQQLEAAERALVHKVAQRYFEAAVRTKLARDVRIVIDRDATLVVRAKHHDSSIVGTFESSVSLYRIFDGEELVRLARSGRFTGGTYSVGSERAHGASWGENISEIIGWGNRQRGHRLGEDLFLAKIDASGRRFYHMTPEVEFQPEGESLQPATMDVSKCSTGLGCSVVDVQFNDATFYRVDPGGQIEPLSDQELHSYMKARPKKDVDLRGVSRVMHSGTIYGVDVNVVLDQEAPDHELQPPSPYYRTWYVEVTRVPAEETVILKGAKTMELAVQKAKKLLQGTTADDWHGVRPVSLLPKAAMDVWRKREQIWQQRARRLSPEAL